MPYLDRFDDFTPYYEIHDYTPPGSHPQTILFVHGFMENTTAWHAWVPYLAHRYRLLMFDIRGFGRTGPVAADATLSTALFADDMVRLINHVAGEPVHIVSGKSGAISVLHLAANRPDLVRSLTLACPPLTAPGSIDWLPYMAEHGMRGWARHTMPQRLGAEAGPRVIDWWVDMMGATAYSTAQAYVRWVVTTEPWRDLAQVTSPTLLILADLSDQTNEVAGQLPPDRIRALLPGVHIELIDRDCYHLAGAYPALCARATEAFLATLDAAEAER